MDEKTAPAWTKVLSAIFAATLLYLEACTGRGSTASTPRYTAYAKKIIRMDAASSLSDGYRVDVAGVSHYFPSSARLQRRSSAGSETLVDNGKGFSYDFPRSAGFKLYRLNRVTAVMAQLSKMPLVNRTTCLDPDSVFCGQTGCDPSTPTCGTCSDCEGLPGAGPESNPDGTSICLAGQCGIDGNGIASGIATFRNVLLGASCNVNLDTLDMACEYNDSNSDGSSGQIDLYHDYFYLLSDASQHLECDAYPYYSLVWATFHDPSMTKTILSIVPGYEAAEFAHASAYVAGTFMQAQYKSGIPLRQVAHCNGAD